MAHNCCRVGGEKGEEGQKRLCWILVVLQPQAASECAKKRHKYAKLLQQSQESAKQR